MCDILKPPEQVPTVTAAPNVELVSAGIEATASVAAIMDTQAPYVEASGSVTGSSSGSSSGSAVTGGV
jgi:heptaprenylglyceryl phosphate synthase